MTLRVGRRQLLRLAAAACGSGVVTAGLAADPPSGLPIPRYVSLKSDRVNVRKGPGTEYAIAWVFERAGLPVEVVKEYENWRQIRDSEGAEGWVLQNLLSGRRTALVLAWDMAKEDSDAAALHDDATTNSPVVAYARPGALANVLGCRQNWCRVSIASRFGYLEQSKLWGVYKDEVIE